MPSENVWLEKKYGLAPMNGPLIRAQLWSTCLLVVMGRPMLWIPLTSHALVCFRPKAHPSFHGIFLGPNLGVEHTSLARVVVNVVQKELGIEVDDVIAFVSDGASVMKAAYDNELKAIFVNSHWVRCLSHALNNVAKVSFLSFFPAHAFFYDRASSLRLTLKSLNCSSWVQHIFMPKDMPRGGAVGLLI